MEKITIGIEKRISLGVLEMALRAALDDNATSEYFLELAHTECTGAIRLKKAISLMNRMTIKSKLMPYLTEHKEDILNLLRSKSDRQLLFVAMMCSAYTIFYDTIAQMGKYFHVQDEVTREYLLKKLSEKYGSNRMLDVAFDCVMPMLIEAGFIVRVKPGIYQMVKQDKFSDVAKRIYSKSFILHPVLHRIVAWNLSAFTFKYLTEDFEYLYHGAQAAVGTYIQQYAELDNQKRVSMSGNWMESNFFCSSVIFTVGTSFF